MKPKVTSIIVCLCFLIQGFLFGQVELRNEFSLTDLYLNINRPATCLNRQLNPGWQIENCSGNHMAYYSSFNSDFGKYKLPYSPQQRTDWNYIAAGENKLFENGLFSGYVGYRQQRLSDKKWVHNRLPYRGLPFLLADSSTGGIELTGIHWQLGYSHELIKNKLYLGSSLFYNVDEEHKTVFPKPINKHRDIVWSNGLGYRINKYLKTGLSFSYFGFQEIMKTSKYSLDQDKTPTFFNIRGLDNPIISRGKTSEERKIDIDGYRLTIDSEVNNLLVDKLSLLGGYEQASADIVDGGAYPVPQGDWFSQRLFFSTNLIISVFDDLQVKIFSTGQSNLQTGEHPDLAIEIYAYREKYLKGGIGLRFPIKTWFVLAPTIYGSSQYLKRVDKFNGILDYYPSNTIGARIGIDFNRYKNLEFSLKIGSEVTEVGDSELYTRGKGWYYKQITASEIRFYQSDKEWPWIDAKLKWYYKPDLNFIFDFHYGSLMPSSNGYFSDVSRNNVAINFSIEY